MVNKNPTREEFKNIRLNYIVHVISRGHYKFINEMLKNCETTIGEYPILLLINKEKIITQSKISEELLVSNANVAKIVRKLEDKGMVKREVNDKNRREKFVSLTEKGKKESQKIIGYEREWETIVTAPLPDNSKFDLKNLLYDLYIKSLEI